MMAKGFHAKRFNTQGFHLTNNKFRFNVSLSLSYYLILLILMFSKPSVAEEMKQIENNNPNILKVESLTIYNTQNLNNTMDYYRFLSNASVFEIPGFGILRFQKDFDLKQERSKILVSNLGAYIDPTTIAFQSITDPNSTRILEQEYLSNPMNNQKLLEYNIEKEVIVEQNYGEKIQTFEGKLLSVSDNIILQDKDKKIISLPNYSNIRLSEMPQNIHNKPILAFEVQTKKLGNHKVEISFETLGITWWANYNALLQEGKDQNNNFLDLNAWVNIVNKSGMDYNIKKLKLVAGSVNRADASSPRSMVAFAKMGGANEGASFKEKTLDDLHLYNFEKEVVLPQNSIKQWELFPKINKIPVEKQYVFIGTRQNFYGQINTNPDTGEDKRNLEVYIKIKNSKKDNLGLPLPEGRIRISKLDKDSNAIEFLGEDNISHTALDETVQIKLGSAFDVVGTRKVLNFDSDQNRHVLEETIEIIIKNHKKDDINVIVKENLYRGQNWKIVETNAQYEKVSAEMVEFPLLVKKDAENKIHYKVRYTW